jgi:hypothetical protein
VDAEPARVHVRALAAEGLGWKRVAALAEVSHGAMSKLLYGTPTTPPSRRIRPKTAARILAVHAGLEQIADHAVIDATGTRRRLQALVAAGWPQNHLADRLGIAPPNFHTTIGAEHILARTARAVAELYNQLAQADPGHHGVNAGSCLKARNHAAKRGWPPPGCWDPDTINAPDAVPEWTGACGTPAGVRIHRREGIPLCPACRDAHRDER